jgi:hypothetical protein
MPPPGRFDFSRAVREWCFVQLPLVELATIRKDATARGLDDFGHMFAPGAWEALDRKRCWNPLLTLATACGITTSRSAWRTAT